MRRSAKRLSLPATLLAAGLLAAGCGSTVSSSIGSLPSRTATAPARPSVTAAPTTQPPAAASAAPAASSGTSLTWLWVLLGVLVLAGLIALIARSARRRSAAAAGWRSRLVDAYAKGSALHDAMSVAEAPGGLAAADAAVRWSDIQRRADDLAPYWGMPLPVVAGFGRMAQRRTTSCRNGKIRPVVRYPAARR